MTAGCVIWGEEKLVDLVVLGFGEGTVDLGSFWPNTWQHLGVLIFIT